MRVLITLGALDAVGGMQVYVRDLAAWLLAHDHSPVVYAPRLGQAARLLRQLTIPVTDDLATIAIAPDVIHGHNALETMAALLHFSSAPALFTCHAWRGADSSAPRFPRLLRYTAVDDTCADRLRLEEGVPPDRLTVLLNGVDLQRYRPRATPLPPRPRRALAFGNAAHEASHVSTIREACRRAGIELDVAGSSSGTFVDEPEGLLAQYDLVFAKAKCALEAMASGAATILSDVAGLGGMVRAIDVPRLRRLNFGARTLTMPNSVDAIAREIAAYDADDATAVSRMIRETASSDELHQKIFALYEDVIAEHAGQPKNWEEESRAASAYLLHGTQGSSESESRLNLVVQATHHVLRAPLVGPALTRVARWLVRRGRTSVS